MRKCLHGMTKTPTFVSWNSMVERTTNIKHKNYKNYGGRGIRICKKWGTFLGFYADMGERPPNTSLDRINNDKGYFKENCRWSTQAEQSRNKRNNIIYNGICATDRSIELGGDRTLILFRLKRGWDLKSAFTLPKGTILKKLV